MTIYKISLIVGSIFPLKSTFAILFTFIEITNICCISNTCSICFSPCFYPLSMLLIFMPIAFIFSTVDINKDTISICFIIFPLSIIDITICVSHSSFQSCFILPPHAFILWTIRPKLYANAISVSSFFVPLAFIQFPITHIFILININTIYSIFNDYFIHT